MNKRAWWGTVYGNHKELDMTEHLSTAQRSTGELRLHMIRSQKKKKLYINSLRPMMMIFSSKDYLLFSKYTLLCYIPVVFHMLSLSQDFIPSYSSEQTTISFQVS